LIRRNRNGLLLAALIFGQVLMIGQQVRVGPEETRLRYWTGSLLLPLQKAAQAAVRLITGSWGQYVWLVGAEQENRKLDAEAARLRIENHFLRQELLRFASRADLDAFRTDLASHTLIARVIASGPSRSAKEVFLDRGQGHGVRPGMAVLTADGIVGKVGVAYEKSSMVLLITDSDAGAGVVLARSGEPGVLRGTSKDFCWLDYIGPHIGVAEGEFVYTSGLDGVYSRGLPVGQVSSVEAGIESQKIRVQPFAVLDRLDEVLIVTERQDEALPEHLQRSLARLRTAGPDENADAIDIRSDPVQTEADRAKQGYRRSLQLQGRKVGQLTGAGPPDFRDALHASRASGGVQPASGAPHR
jgi:rod shape-determining protein MreC